MRSRRGEPLPRRRPKLGLQDCERPIETLRQRPAKQLAREHRSFVAVLLIQIKAKELAERILGEAGAIFIPERAIAGAAGDDAHEVSGGEARGESRLSDQSKPARVSRRTVLIAAAGSAAAGADKRQRGSKNGADDGEISAHAQRRQTVQRLQPLRCAQFMQVCRRRYRAQRMVLDLGEKGRVTIQPGADRSLAMTNDRDG